MSFYNPAPKEAILYYAQVMAGSWGYKPVVYAKRMGWLDSDEKDMLTKWKAKKDTEEKKELFNKCHAVVNQV